MSGANNIPLGQRLPGGGLGAAAPVKAAPTGGSLLNPTYLLQNSFKAGGVIPGNTPNSQPPPPPSAPRPPPPSAPAAGYKRPASSALSSAVAAAKEAAAKAERKRKRKSRWGGGESDKTFIPGMPTMLPIGLTKDQEEAYLLQLKIEDSSRRLRTGDLGIPPNPEDRSPSPEPIYSSDGKRLNTREYRKRKELEETRHESIQRMIEINTDYKPPPDYKPPQVKVNDKVMIPQDDHPDINFVGLLIGPRGNTLKAMERDTGAKIIIRGKGSVKEGKVGRKDGQPLPGEDEPLHAYVTATNPEAVKKAVDKIKDIIKQGVEVPEGQNDLRRNQLRELALLNGTLREGEGPRCSNCGASDHKSWQCQDKPNVTNNVVCTSCGGVGHIAKDCSQKRPGHGFGPGNAANKNKIDEEYMSLMAELGEGPPPEKVAERPWQRNSGGGGNVFNRPSAPRALGGPSGGGGNRPPGPPGEFGGGGSYNNGWGGNKPPSLMSQNIPPPWQQQQQGGGRWGGGGAPPRGPPPMQPPQWGAPPGSNPGVYEMPPPNFLAAPPPPPPPASGSEAPPTSTTATTSPSWTVPPWGGPPGVPNVMPPPPPGQAGPGPVPPPPGGPPGGGSPRGGSAPPPHMPPYGWPPQGGWQAGPVAPPGQNAPPRAGSLNLSNLIAAPPPPPPS